MVIPYYSIPVVPARIFRGVGIDIIDRTKSTANVSLYRELDIKLDYTCREVLAHLSCLNNKVKVKVWDVV